jgi:hypothetical protein
MVNAVLLVARTVDVDVRADLADVVGGVFPLCSSGFRWGRRAMVYACADPVALEMDAARCRAYLEVRGVRSDHIAVCQDTRSSGVFDAFDRARWRQVERQVWECRFSILAVPAGTYVALGDEVERGRVREKLGDYGVELVVVPDGDDPPDRS